jgi:hypothetical protein
MTTAIVCACASSPELWRVQKCERERGVPLCEIRGRQAMEIYGEIVNAPSTTPRSTPRPVPLKANDTSPLVMT